MAENDPRVTEALIALNGQDPERMRSAVAKLSETSDDRRVVDVLVKALGAPFWHVRKLASAILIEMGDSVIRRFDQQLPFANLDQAYWMLFTLARLGPAADMILLAQIGNDLAEVRRYAIHNLAKRKGDGAILALIEALNDPVWLNRKKAAEALWSRPDAPRTVTLVKQEMARGNRNRVYWGVRILGKLLGARALPIMKKLLEHPDDDLKYLAVSALGNLKAEDAIPWLIDKLGDHNPIVQEKAAEVLQSFGYKVVDRLADHARVAHPEIRYGCLRILFRLSPAPAVRLAEELFRNPDVEVRYAVVRAAASSPSRECIGLLLRAFADPIWMVRKLASNHLAAMGEKAIPVLEEGLRTDEENVLYWSIATLGKIGQKGLNQLELLLVRGEQSVRGFAIDAISENEPVPYTIYLLIKALDDRCWPLRRQAATGLVRGGTVAAPHVFKKIDAPKENLRYWSRIVIQEIFQDRLQPLFEFLEECLEGEREGLVARLGSLSPGEFERIVLLPIPELLAEIKRIPA